MKLKELLENVNDEIKTDRIKKAQRMVKDNVLQIEELKRALVSAEKNLDDLLEKDVDDVDIDVW